MRVKDVETPSVKMRPRRRRVKKTRQEKAHEEKAHEEKAHEEKAHEERRRALGPPFKTYQQPTAPGSDRAGL
ncbi:MAG: hypothetical protein AAF590_06485 [Pseudomonadota bacterium]